MPARFPSQRQLLTFLLASALCAGPAFAQKPEHAGGGKHEDKAERKADKKADKAERKADKHEAKQQRDSVPGVASRPADDVGKGTRMGRKELQPGAYFNDRHREAVRTYYVQNHGGKKSCPPGLAKKNNGCMPPGQAKKWNIGQPLPAGVTVYSVPQPVLVRLPPQPPGYRYVRVATDILLIAIGTQMVVDGITDLMRL